jgi:hypothetical protein
LFVFAKSIEKMNPATKGNTSFHLQIGNGILEGHLVIPHEVGSNNGTRALGTHMAVHIAGLLLRETFVN